MPAAPSDHGPQRPLIARIRALGWWPAFILAMAWVAVGIFPCAPVEGDDIAISVGAHVMAEHGSTELAYRYDAQPGAYVLTAFGRLLGLPTHLAFCLLTATSFVAFVLMSALFVARVTGLAVPLCGVLMLLFQETWTSAYFANSNMPSAALIAGSLLVASRGTGRAASPAAAALMAAAAWVRLDAILMLPALGMLIFRERERRVERIAVAALIFVVILSLLLTASGASVFTMISEYTKHIRGYLHVGRTLNSYATVFTAFTAVLMVLGTLRLAVGRSFWTLGIVAAGVLPTVLVYGLTLTTPKYLLATLIFAAVLTASGIRALRRSRQRVWLVPLLASLFVAQYLADPFVLLGISRQVATHDGVRDLAALTGSPARWSHSKRRSRRTIQEIDRAIHDLVATQPNPVIVSNGRQASQIVLYRLMMMSDSERSPVVFGREAREAHFVVGTKQVTALWIRVDKSQALTPSIMRTLGIGSGSRILVISKRRSLNGLPPNAVKTQIGQGRPGAWMVEIP